MVDRKREENADIFLDVQNRIGCPYISNLHNYQREISLMMKDIEFEKYPAKQIKDFLIYVFEC